MTDPTSTIVSSAAIPLPTDGFITTLLTDVIKAMERHGRRLTALQTSGVADGETLIKSALAYAKIIDMVTKYQRMYTDTRRMDEDLARRSPSEDDELNGELDPEKSRERLAMQSRLHRVMRLMKEADGKVDLLLACDTW